MINRNAAPLSVSYTHTRSRSHIWRRGCSHPRNSNNNTGFSSRNYLYTCRKFSWHARAVATRSALSNLMAVSLPYYASFDVHADDNAGPRWETWLARLQRMFIGIRSPQRAMTNYNYLTSYVTSCFKASVDGANIIWRCVWP